MSRLQAWFVHFSNVLVGGTGLVYAFLRYALEPVDPYSVVNHPAEPALQHLHLWAAPLLVFAVGLIWHEHAWKHWRRGVKGGRRSGLTLIGTAAPMVVSGYLIQTAVTPAWRTGWVVLHLVASTLWLAGYLAHALAKKQRGPIAV